MTLSGGTISCGTTSSRSGSSHGTTRSSSSFFGSDGDDIMELQARLDMKRKRRMESNRESAKRSRQRKQQHVDDLNSQVEQLRTKNSQLVAALSITAQNYGAAEAQNSVLRTQMVELDSRLSALRDMLCYMNATKNQHRPFANYYNPAAATTTATAAASSAAAAYPAPTMIMSNNDTAANYDAFVSSSVAWNYSGVHQNQMMAPQPMDELLYQCF